MNFVIICIGRARQRNEGNLFKRYADRIKYPLKIIELEERQGFTGEELKSRESKLLIDKIPKSAFVVALDLHGKQFSSDQFAKQVQDWQEQNIRNLVFLIGGSSGFSKVVWDRANFVMSLSLSTWPHLLVRVLLVEQIYRAQCILTGHPYHKT